MTKQEPLPETEPEWVMLNAMRRVMADFGCVRRVEFRVDRDDDDHMKASITRPGEHDDGF